MATSHDDVSELETAHNKVNALVDHSDGDTTAAATAPANRKKAGLPSPPGAEDDDEDRTVQQPVDPKVRNASRNAALALGDKAARPPPPPAPVAAPPPPAPPLRITSKKMTAVGLGPVRPAEQTPQPGAPPAPPPTPMSASPPPVTPTLGSSGSPTLKDPSKKNGALASASSPSPSPPPPPPSSVPSLASQADAADDSITATAPAPRISVNGTSLPITVPSIVKITELGDEPLDETEVRTVVTGATEDSEALTAAAESLAAPTSSSPAPLTDPAPTAPGKPKAPLESVPPTTEADEPDDSVTTQAPSPLSGGRLLPEEDEPRTSPPMLAPRLGSRPPIPAAGRRPEIPGPPPVPMSAPMTARTGPHSPNDEGDEDQYEADESVTTRGPAIADRDFADDSVTAQAPVTRSSSNGPVALASPPTFEETDGTTKRVPKGNQPAKPGSPEELQSVTSEAPAGHLSNMLRVIANGASSNDDDDDDHDGGGPRDDSDDSAENKTAVMLNAPVKPPPAAGAPPPAVSSRPRFPAAIPAGGGRRTAAIADLREDFRESSSDSGLRIARAEAPSGDHASMNALLAGTPIEQQHHQQHGHPHPQRGSGVSEKNNDANPFAKTQQAFATPGPRSRSRSEQASVRVGGRHDSPPVDFAASIKKPRYGLIVAAVAVLSFAIPLILFLWLHSGTTEAAPREPSGVNPDIVKPDPPRPKAPASARAAIAASASAAARKNDPLRRH